MEIEKNIATTLKHEMNKHGENLLALSERLNIPASTLQGYLKGMFSPRADTLEDIAHKLDITPAELVSGMRFSCNPGELCLDVVALEILRLHPDVRPLAENALSLLRNLFALSEKFSQESQAENSEENSYQYISYETRVPFRQIVTYGILVKERLHDKWITVAMVGAFSRNKEAVAQLARTCTELQLSPEHLLDVIHDFIARAPSSDI